MHISILGAPGSGKTTQAQLLSKSLHIPVVSIGEELRELAKSQDSRSKVVHKALKEGGLVPAEIVLEILWARLSKDDTDRGFVLDGIPRTAGEARSMIGKFSLDRVFHLKVGSSAVFERLMRRGREDDKPELIQKRFEIYKQEIKAILQFYKSLGVLVEIDATPSSILDINQEMISKLQ